MTPEQIAELEALAEKATPGPWEVEEDPTQDGDHATLVCTSGKFGQMGTWLLGCFHNWKEAAKGERRISWKEAESNATLIVALVNNLPAILAALKAQQPGDDVSVMERALISILDAVRQYVPPDGITQDQLIDHVIGATDNPEINPVIRKIERRAAIAAMQENPDEG